MINDIDKSAVQKIIRMTKETDASLAEKLASMVGHMNGPNALRFFAETLRETAEIVEDEEFQMRHKAMNESHLAGYMGHGTN